MCRFITILLLTIVLARPAPALAVNPTYTTAQTITIELIDYKSADTEDLNISFSDQFRDLAVGVAATVVVMVTEYGSLNTLVLVAVSFLAVIFLLSVLLNRAIQQQLNELGDEPGEFDVYGQRKSPEQLKQEREGWRAERTRLQGGMRSRLGDIGEARRIGGQYWKKERKIRRLR